MTTINKYICNGCGEVQYAIKLEHCRQCGSPITDTFNGLFKGMVSIIKTYSANIPASVTTRHKE